MKDLTKYFIDLRKLSEEQRKSLPQKVNVFYITAEWLSKGREDKNNPFLTYYEDCWIGSAKFYTDGLTELQYPDFIKLFEGGEEETEAQKLKKQIDLYKECFELFIPIEKWDEANEFLSINGNPLAKHLSRVQKEVEKKPKF